jgi:hypothetical protein
MAEIIYSVFVSSTFEDLREERSEVQKALLKLKCFPIGMEVFPSADDDTLEFIKRQIDEADYYVVIIAGQYGSIASDGVSFTEKEYDYATEVEKPISAFLHGEPGKIPNDKSEAEPVKREALKSFVSKIRSRSPTTTFTSPHELAKEVTVSIVNLRNRKTGHWFCARGSDRRCKEIRGGFRRK